MHVYRYIIFSFLLLVGYGLNAQNKVQLSADRLDYDEAFLPGVDRFIGNVVFTHGETVGYCDSAYFYQDRNYVEGFGKRIRIDINDSVTLFGKFFIYDGDNKVTTISHEVVLQDKTSSLFTDSLTYLTDKDQAYYLTGGKMVNADNVLTSVIGNYYMNINKIVLEQEVKLVNKSYTMDCDSLAYNTQTEIVQFISRTHLVSDENTIYTNSGWYDTKSDVAQLVDSVELYNKTQTLNGDSVYYDKKIRFGIGKSNIAISDKEKGYVLKGNYVEHYEEGGWSTATDSSVLILIDDNDDSLYVHGDTLRLLIDSLQDPQLLLAYDKVKFFREDLQGACDSLSFHIPDSLLLMYYDPVIWSGENQLTADTITFTIVDSAHIVVHLLKSAFIAASIFDETDFNQIKGINIVGYIVNQELKRVDVISNAECLYFLQEEDSSLVGINSSETSEMHIELEHNEIKHITFYNSPDGEINPDTGVLPEDRKLKDFRWLRLYRPVSETDIFHTPIPRIWE